MNDTPYKDATNILYAARAEYATVTRAKEYGAWRRDNVWPITSALKDCAPFKDYRTVWIFTGDGGGCSTFVKLGEWVIDHFVDGLSPEQIVAAFLAEVQRNVANYIEVSPALGVQIDEHCDLPQGASITPAPEPDALLGRLVHYETFQPFNFSTDTSVLMQPLRVTPSFEVGTHKEALKSGESITVPTRAERDELRRQIRLACLLASAGAVEFPDQALRPDRNSLYVAGEGNSASRPHSPRPIVPFPVQAKQVKRNLDLLSKFDDADSISRAIDRLGRARLAASQVDRALELGVAAEIALMHDNNADNNEITHKISTRAAWLIGKSVDDRTAIFSEIKKLYQARSQAVHNGALSSKLTIDLDEADRLVVRVFAAILELGRFPVWGSLVMGGPG